MSDVAVIIVSYNTKELTLKCIESIYEKTQNVNFEVVVVDNNSQDGSPDAIAEKFPDIKVIKNNENLGFGKANNVGIEQSQSKYVFLLNPDTILKNNAVKILYDYMESNEIAGAAGGMLYDIDGNKTFSFGRLPLLKDKVKLILLPHFLLSKDIRGKINFNNIQDIQEVGFISGADLMLRRDVINKTGAFDKDFFLYYEETELQYRIKKTGYNIYIVPQAKILHLEGKSSSKKSRREESFKSEYLYYKKCYKLTKFSPFKIIFLMYLFGRFFSKPQMIYRVVKYIVKV